MAELTHIVILGAGFAGIGALKKLRDADVRITIVDKRDYHTFQPLLYQVATDELGPTEVGFPIRELLHGHKNITYHQAAVKSVDLAQKQVVMDGVAAIPYDYLVLALGAVANFYHTPGADQYAFPLYTMEDAIRLKEHILKTFEAVDKNPALMDDGALTFCVVGGGPTGVELTGALVELLHTELKEDYPNLPVEKAQVLLYEHSPTLLGTFAPRLESYARKALEERGAKVQAGTGVSKIGPSSIELSTGATVKTHTTVWAAGLQANPDRQLAGGGTGARWPHSGRLRPSGERPPGSLRHRRYRGHDRRQNRSGGAGAGATALQAGRHVGETIKRLLDGKPPEPFEYFNKGMMAQVGRGAAVVELPTGGTMTGHLAWLAWLGVHLALLNGAEEKAGIIVDWGWNILTHKRGKRIILSDDDVAAAQRGQTNG